MFSLSGIAFRCTAALCSAVDVWGQYWEERMCRKIDRLRGTSHNGRSRPVSVAGGLVGFNKPSWILQRLPDAVSLVAQLWSGLAVDVHDNNNTLADLQQYCVRVRRLVRHYQHKYMTSKRRIISKDVRQITPTVTSPLNIPLAIENPSEIYILEYQLWIVSVFILIQDRSAIHEWLFLTSGY